MAREGRKPKAVAKNVPARNAPTRPKALAGLVSTEGGHTQPIFSFALTDRSYRGEWGWHLLDNQDARKLLDLMCDMAQLTWSEVLQQGAAGHRRHHHQPVGNLCAEARRRIEQLELDDMGDRMFRFRLDGPGRLWGYELGDGIFHVVWWDPLHKVYPTDPD